MSTETRGLDAAGLAGCPFCGCTDVRHNDNGHEEWYECDWCCATSGYDPEFEGKPPEWHWNRRATPSAATPAGEVTDAMVERALRDWFDDDEWPTAMANGMADDCRASMRAALEAALASQPPATPPVAPAPTGDEVAGLPEFIRNWTPPFHVTSDGIKDARGCWICSAANHSLAVQLVELMNFAAELAALRDETIKVVERFAARCEEAVRPDDADNDGVTVKTRYLRAARALLAKLKGRKG